MGFPLVSPSYWAHVLRGNTYSDDLRHKIEGILCSDFLVRMTTL